MKHTKSIQRIKNCMLSNIRKAKGIKELEIDFMIETAQHFGVIISKSESTNYCIIDNQKIVGELTEKEIKDFLDSFN